MTTSSHWLVKCCQSHENRVIYFKKERKTHTCAYLLEAVIIGDLHNCLCVCFDTFLVTTPQCGILWHLVLRFPLQCDCVKYLEPGRSYL